MGFNWWPFSAREDIPQQTSIKESENEKHKLNQFMVKVMGYISKQGSQRAYFEYPEYNLLEIKRAAESDSYIKLSLLKYSQLLYKAGYELKGTNDKAPDYIKKRFRIMSYATKKPMDILFQEIGDDLIKFSNAFLIKSRVEKIAPGIRAVGITENKFPIGGYFRVDPTTMRIKRNKNGKVIKYEQSAGGNRKEFMPDEVIHFYMDKEPEAAYGTPRMVAALEDVKILRRIEGNIISLIYRFAIPIYQWKVGLAQAGFEASETEIRDVKKEVEKTPMDGVIVTNEKTDIKAIGAEGNALDATGYLEYFENRVFSALNLTQAQVGRGGGAAKNADSMDEQVHDTVKHIQRVLSIFIEYGIITELLLEGGFDPIMNEDDIVKYVFNEISLDTKIKLENHELLKFQSNLVPFEEAREAIGKRKDIDEERLYANMIEANIAERQIETQTNATIKVQDAAAKNQEKLAKINAQNQKASAAATDKKGNGNGKNKANGKPTNQANNNNRPTNQHGTTSVNIKESLTEIKSNKTETYKNAYPAVYKSYDHLRNVIIEMDSDNQINNAKKSIIKETATLIQSELQIGANNLYVELSKTKSINTINPNLKFKRSLLEKEVSKTIDKLIKDITLKLSERADRTYVDAVFNSLEYRITFMLAYILDKAYWTGYLKAAASYNVKKVYIHYSSEEDEEMAQLTEINPKDYELRDIPPYHPFDRSMLTLKEKEV